GCHGNQQQTQSSTPVAATPASAPATKTAPASATIDLPQDPQNPVHTPIDKNGHVTWNRGQDEKDNFAICFDNLDPCKKKNPIKNHGRSARCDLKGTSDLSGQSFPYSVAGK